MLGRNATLWNFNSIDPLKSAAIARCSICLLGLLILGGVLGCAVSALQPINARGPIDLAPNEALLIIHVDTDIPLDVLFLNNRAVAQSLGKGRHVWMIKVPPGSFRWKRIEVDSGQRRNLRFQLEDDEEYRFDVVAGKINYPGELIVRAGVVSRWGRGTLVVRNRNHSAMAVRVLQGSHGHTLRAYPLHYAGTSGDGFLEYYTRERDRIAVSAGEVARPEPRTENRMENH